MNCLGSMLPQWSPHLYSHHWLVSFVTADPLHMRFRWGLSYLRLRLPSAGHDHQCVCLPGDVRAKQKQGGGSNKEMRGGLSSLSTIHGCGMRRRLILPVLFSSDMNRSNTTNEELLSYWPHKSCLCKEITTRWRHFCLMALAFLLLPTSKLKPPPIGKVRQWRWIITLHLCVFLLLLYLKLHNDYQPEGAALLILLSLRGDLTHLLEEVLLVSWNRKYRCLQKLK